MATYRYRFLRTMYDKIVGVAVQKPDGSLMMQVGTQLIEFGQDAPSLNILNHYVDTIAEKPQFKALKIYDVSKVYTTQNFVNCQRLMDEGKNFLIE